MILQVAKQLAPQEEGAPSHVDLMRVSATDLNPVACDMTFINTTMWGIPARIEHGNALSLESFSIHENFHWKRVGENDRIMMQEMIRLLSQPAPEPSTEKPDQKPGPTLQSKDYDLKIPSKEGSSGQWEMDF